MSQTAPQSPTTFAKTYVSQYPPDHTSHQKPDDLSNINIASVWDGKDTMWYMELKGAPWHYGVLGDKESNAVLFCATKTGRGSRWWKTGPVPLDAEDCADIYTQIANGEVQKVKLGTPTQQSVAIRLDEMQGETTAETNLEVMSTKFRSLKTSHRRCRQREILWDGPPGFVMEDTEYDGNDKYNEGDEGR